MAARVYRAQVAATVSALVRVHRAQLAVGSGVPRVHRAQVAASGVLTSSAGVDQSVDGLTVVQLNGSGSSGSPTRWTWTQTGGPAVTLLDADTPLASFVAPGTTGGTTLTFQLVVGSGTTSAAPDTVTVTVFPHVEWRNLGGSWVPVRTDLITSAAA